MCLVPDEHDGHAKRLPPERAGTSGENRPPCGRFIATSFYTSSHANHVKDRWHNRISRTYS